SEHSELQACRFRHHRGIPGRVPDQLHVGGGDAGDALHLALYLAGERTCHRAAGGREGHLDLDGAVALDVDVVDEPQLVDVDRDLRIEDGLESFDDPVLDVGRIGGNGRGGGMGGFLVHCELHSIPWTRVDPSLPKPPAGYATPGWRT